MKSEFSFTNNEFKLNNRYKNMNIYEKWLLGDTSVVILLNSMTHYCKMV